MHATRLTRLPLILLVLLLAGTPVVAQEDPTAADTDGIVQATLDLTDGDRTWLAIHRASLSDDDPAIPARDGMLYAIDAPLLLLYEGESRVGRLLQGEGVVLKDGEEVRAVAQQAGPASLLAVGLADPAATSDPYAPVGEPFAVPAGTYTVTLWRYEFDTRPDRVQQAVNRDLAASPYPALIYVEQGEITATPAGQDTAATFLAHQTIAADGSSNLDVSDDGAVILLVTLAPAVTPTAVAGTTTQVNADSGLLVTPSPTATASVATTATAEATTVPTTVPTVPVAVDTDGDGLSDTDEAARGTSPTSQDSDGDGVFDGYEVSVGLDPTKPDTDGDGISDYEEVPEEPVQGSGDADGDGLTDGYEGQVSLTDPNDADSDDDGLNDGDENTRGTNPLDADSDDDQLNDGDESIRGTSPLDADSDDDGLNDYDEVSRATNPTNRDTDGEGLSDGFEVNQGSSPLDRDTDFDGVDDGYETGRGMNPRSADSDGDGLSDGDEVNTWGSNPLNPDSDGDERGDGYEVNCGQDPNTFTDYSDVVACG